MPSDFTARTCAELGGALPLKVTITSAVSSAPIPGSFFWSEGPRVTCAAAVRLNSRMKATSAAPRRTAARAEDGCIGRYLLRNVRPGQRAVGFTERSGMAEEALLGALIKKPKKTGNQAK